MTINWWPWSAAIYSALLLLACLLIVSAAAAGDLLTGQVVTVVDGDTVHVVTGSGKIKVRLYGIDCPEFGQPYGRAATNYVINQVAGRQVLVEVITVDRYGRQVAWIHTNGGSLNADILRAGLGWHYVKYSNSQALANAEAFARGRQIGLWRDADPMPPWEWRKRQ